MLSKQSRNVSALASQSIREWATAIGMWRLWIALGTEDLIDRYRKTFVGIFWVAISFGVFVLVKVTIFGQMTKASLEEFTLYVTIGFGLWTFISSMVIDGCLVYSRSRSWILGTNIPYPVFFLQCVYRNLLVFAMVLLVVAAILVWQKQNWSLTMLMAIPGLLMFVITSVWLSALFAPLCARHRDVQHLVQTMMRLLFFATPIIWMTPRSGTLALFAKYNLVTHFIEIVRQPLIYGHIPYDSWLIVLTANALGLAAGFASYTLTRNQIAYWL